MNPRSYLFVPGNRADLIAKALTSAADAVIIDLEDAVPPHHKDAARDQTRTTLTKLPQQHPQIWVRINQVRTDTAERDLAALAGSAAGIRVPKVDNPSDLEWVASRCGSDTALLATIETARGLHEAAGIAACPTVTRLGLGGLDLVADLGCADHPMALLHARSTLVLASRVAGLPGPINSVYTRLRDDTGLHRHARHAATLGFGAQSIISPRQIDPVHQAYAPDATHIAWAEDVLAAFRDADGQATTTHDGQFVDLPVARRATAIAGHPANTGS